MFLPQEIIRAKRDGKILPAADITAFVNGIVNHDVSDAQIGAFCMASYFQGLDWQERTALMGAMRDSGQVMRWEHLNGPTIDKHSTGGIGDMTSLILAPMLAACGAYVPMIAGRGLGHTGGTVDKMESIPGYETGPDTNHFQQIVAKTGCAIIGQTERLAPADKHIYAVRDVTATVESIGLITASILSKKLAAGIGALVMDVKFGKGAFMTDISAAEELADSIARVSTLAGTPCVALLTDMNAPLGFNAGNALEVMEVIDFITGKRRAPRLYDITMALAIEMMLLAKLADSPENARMKLDAVLESGAVAEKFAEMVAAMGGAHDLLTRPEHYLPQSPVIQPVYATHGGFITDINSREIGLAVVELGGGRRTPSDRLNLAVGFSQLLAPGVRVETDTPLAFIHAASSSDAERAAARLRTAYHLGDAAPAPAPLIAARVQP